jgi:acyl carrier protein
MESEDLQSEIRDLIAEIIEIDAARIEPARHLVTELGADSMNALEIMACLERKYGIVIEPSALPEMVSLGRVTALVRGLRLAQSA